MMKLTQYKLFLALLLMALPIAWSGPPLIARDIPSLVQTIFKNITGPYAEAVRRTHVLDTIDLNKTYYTYLVPEYLGMSDKEFLARKDLVKVIKYHIFVGAIHDIPGEGSYDRLARDEPVRVRTLLGPIVTVTQQGRLNQRRTFVNGVELESGLGDVPCGNGNIISVETLIPFPKNIRGRE